jgi:hypothetical protein
MIVLGECMLSLPFSFSLAQDPSAVAGCFQADATVQAAEIGRIATINAANRTLVAAIIAFFGGAFVLCQTILAHRINERGARRRIAATYLAEMRSLHDFLGELDIIGKLREGAENNKRVVFHPGDHWLKTYISDPTGIGVFNEKLGAEIVSYCCQMHNQLGRLRWMHDTSKKPPLPPWMANEQNQTAKALADLDMQYVKIASQLRSRQVDKG